MLVEFAPRYLILYDWIAVALESLLLILLIWKYGYEHPGLTSFLITQILIFALFASWNNIFLNEVSGKILSAFAQMLMLAPIVFSAAMTIGNVKFNLSGEKEEENAQGRML